ncbi:MAG TPA: hypothetical protein ENI37_00905 [Chloroflexi bacterium]|nr:hypothetical protein [Chloroflexota bacterium]
MVKQALPPAFRSDPRARRRLFLDIARRRARPGTGSALPFLEQRMTAQEWPDLTSILAGIPWAVVGGVATRTYMPERATHDLDILVAEADAEDVHARLRSAGFTRLQELSIGGTVWRTPEGVLVDIVESCAPWVVEALRQPQADPQGLPVLSLPHLVLMKVQSGRTQDLADASRMLGLASDEQRRATRRVFEQWLPDALEDLESLIALGELEMGNVRPGTPPR